MSYQTTFYEILQSKHQLHSLWFKILRGASSKICGRNL